MGILQLEGQLNETDADSDAVPTFLPCESSTPRSAHPCRAGASLPGPEEQRDFWLSTSYVLERGRSAHGSTPRVAVAVVRHGVPHRSCLSPERREASILRSLVVACAVYWAKIVSRSLFCQVGRHRTRIILKRVRVQPMTGPVEYSQGPE